MNKCSCVLDWLSAKFLKASEFLFCWRNYGFSNAVKLNLLVGSTSFKRTVKLVSGKAGELSFTFRGQKDRGVLSHLIKDGYLIEETEQCPVRTVLDCGANIGDETLRFFFHHPQAEITAVEADADNFALLRDNCCSVPRLLPIYGAVWSEDTKLWVSKSATGNPEASSVANTGCGAPVRAYTIESLMQLRDWKEIDILKLDIEGAEKALFSGDTGWLSKVNCLVFEVPDSDAPGTLQLMFSKLENSRWNGVSIGENLVLIRNGCPWVAQRVAGIRKTGANW